MKRKEDEKEENENCYDALKFAPLFLCENKQHLTP